MSNSSKDRIDQGKREVRKDVANARDKVDDFKRKVTNH